MRPGWIERLQRGPALLLDGATGTELERRGIPSTLPLWSTHALLEAPEAVRAVHASYVRAGADAVTANTFRTQERCLVRGDAGGRASELTRLAVGLARQAAEAAERPVAVLGSAPPLEDCFAPERVPPDAELEAEHGAHARALAEAGVDGVLIETMNCIREARAALRAAHAAGLPAIVSFVCWRGARLLSGEPLEAAIAALAAEQPVALAVNCLPGSNTEPCLDPLAQAGVPFGFYPNLGAPLDEPSDAAVVRHAEALTPERLATLASHWVARGATLVGGCCGTTPAHIAALATATR